MKYGLAVHKGHIQCPKLRVHPAPGVQISTAGCTVLGGVHPVCARFLSHLLLLYIERVHGAISRCTVLWELHPASAQNKSLISDTDIIYSGLAQTGRQVASGDECRDLATKTMKWRHFWRPGEGLGPPDAKQVFQESRVYENTLNMKSFISLDREHYSLGLLFLIDNPG